MPLTQVQGQMLNGSNNTTTTIQSNGTTAITIDSSQNVGIGTTETTRRLNVYESESTANSSTSFWNLTYGGISIRNTSNTTNTLAGISLLGGSSGNSVSAIANIQESSTLGALGFYTGGSGRSNTVPERMRIDSSGRLLIGTTAAYDTAYRVSLAPTTSTGGIIFKNGTTSAHYPLNMLNSSGSSVGYIESGNASTAYVTSSDYRLKENIVPMTGALNTVAQLKPCTYTWKVDGSSGQGFIAHELQEVVPECVTGEKDAVNEDGSIKPQGVDTSFLVATLTAAIQELKAELDATKAEVAELKATLP